MAHHRTADFLHLCGPPGGSAAITEHAERFRLVDSASPDSVISGSVTLPDGPGYKKPGPSRSLPPGSRR
jgi:hypothetical protein